MDVKVAENLWASTMLPEGIVERWFLPSGTVVKAGERLAEIRIEDALHEITAPIGGRLTIRALKNDLVQPGSVLGEIEPQMSKGA